MISSGLWERAFGGDPGVLGRSLRIRSQPYLVVGVAPPGFAGMVPILGADLWTPMTWVNDVTPMGILSFVNSRGETRLERRGQRWLFVKGRLRDGVTLARAAASLDVIMANLAAAYPDSNQDRQASLTLTDDVRLPPQWAGPVDIGKTPEYSIRGGVCDRDGCHVPGGGIFVRATGRPRAAPGRSPPTRCRRGPGFRRGRRGPPARSR